MEFFVNPASSQFQNPLWATMPASLVCPCADIMMAKAEITAEIRVVMFISVNQLVRTKVNILWTFTQKNLTLPRSSDMLSDLCSVNVNLIILIW